MQRQFKLITHITLENLFVIFAGQYEIINNTARDYGRSWPISRELDSMGTIQSIELECGIGSRRRAISYNVTTDKGTLYLRFNDMTTQMKNQEINASELISFVYKKHNDNTNSISWRKCYHAV